MKRYRFYYISGGQRMYLTSKWSAISSRADAILFTEADWQEWGINHGWQLDRQEVGEDQLMRLAGAPRLPGMDA